MTSKLIVNSLAADTGVSTITFADQAKMGNSIFHSTGFTIGDSFLHSTGVNLTNINATGVITATKFVGEVSVGSSITFEDGERAYFGTGTDFSIYHNGSASYLDETGTGGLIAKTNTAFQVFNSAGSQPALTVTPGGSVELYHNNTKRIETTNTGSTVTGSLLTTGNISINNVAPKIFLTDSDSNSDFAIRNMHGVFGIHDSTNSADRLVITSDGKVIIANGGNGGTADVNADNFVVKNYTNSGSCGISILNVDNQNATLYFGNASDTKHAEVVWSDASNLFLIGTSNAGASIKFRTADQSDALLITHQGRIGLNGVTPTSSHANVTSSIHLADSNTILSRTGNQYFALYQNLKQTSADVTRYLVNGYASAYVQHTGTHRWYTVGNGTGNTNATVTERLRIYNDGRVAVNQPTGTGFSTGKVHIKSSASNIGQLFLEQNNAVDGFMINQDGPNGGHLKFVRDIGGTQTVNVLFRSDRGICFNGDSAPANALDDYEEGSFSPTLVNGNNGYRFQQGTYTKIGNLVTFTAYIETSATPPSGNLAFGGLPFASIGSRSWVFPFHTNRTSFGTASFDARAYLGGTDTNVYIYYPVNSSSSNFQPINQNGMNAANASAVWITGSYQTSA